MSLLACPDCGGNLGRDALKCRCGWKRASELPRLIVPCAREDCATPAAIREHMPTGWAHLCEQHWLAEATKQANMRNEARGLFTTEQRIAYCRRMLKGLPMVEREPGQDDEENRELAETSN